MMADVPADPRSAAGGESTRFMPLPTDPGAAPSFDVGGPHLPLFDVNDGIDVDQDDGDRTQFGRLDESFLVKNDGPATPTALSAPTAPAAGADDLATTGTPPSAFEKAVDESDTGSPGDPNAGSLNALGQTFQTLVDGEQASWQVDYKLVRQIGSGGQGQVFLADRVGAFGVHFRVALKFFEPTKYETAQAYQADMARMARLTAQMANLQDEAILDVTNVIRIGGVLVLEMEFIDGYNLRQLLDARMLDRTQRLVPDWRYDYITDVIATLEQPDEADPCDTAAVRLQPGVAISIARECLTGLAELHRAGIVHADVKPANIMIRRSGSAKMIDNGSSFTWHDAPERTSWTPRYAAPEVMLGRRPTPNSDLASLGYALLEMLTGRLPWDNDTSLSEQVEIKRYLPEQVRDLLPGHLSEDDVLPQFLKRLIHTDPNERFASAESADLDADGAAAFHRQLVKGDLDSQYRNELRMWIDDLGRGDRSRSSEEPN